MKKSLMFLSAMMISTFMFAQNDAAPQRHGGNRESMKTVLSLDDKQSSSIEEINKKYHEKGKEQRKTLEDQRQAEISKVLTPEQNKKWTDYKKERAEKFASARDQQLKRSLSLTDDQLTKLKSTLSEEQINKLAFRKGDHQRGHKGHRK